MKRKLTLFIILLALILAFTAGVVTAKPQPQTYLNCERGTACTVDAEGGSAVNVWFLGSCSVMPVQMGIFIICN